MTLEEYAAAQQAISAALVRDVLRQSTPFQRPKLRVSDWNNLLRVLFALVFAAREQSAMLAREFYDSEREQHHPNLPRFDMPLNDYRQEWFSEDMFPAREDFLKPGASENALTQVALRAVKAVENGGRRQILRAVGEDKVVKGWARIATGRETCGFCMMLVSRGPVYSSAANSGLNTDDVTAERLWSNIENASSPAEKRAAEEEMDLMMTKWHAGCDCKVVPVFDRANWPGRDAYKRAEAIWKDVTKGYSGRDAMNAFRRAIENGTVDIKKMSAVA